MGLNRWLTLGFIGLIALTACSEDPDILYSKAETEAALGSRQAALGYLMEIQKSSPDYTEAYLFAAQLFFEDNNLAEAVNQCKRGLDAQADSSMILRYIGEIYQLSGSLENAYQYFRMAVAATVGKAITLTNSGNTARAIELLDAAVKDEPMEGAAYGALAMAQEKTAVEDQVILDNYALAVKLASKNKTIWEAYVAFMINDQETKQAVKVLQNYLYHFPEAIDGRHYLAELYLDLALKESLSWLDAARQQCEQALISDSNDHYSHALLARIYLLQEKPRLAILEAQLAFEIHPNTEYRELVDQAKFFQN